MEAVLNETKAHIKADKRLPYTMMLKIINNLNHGNNSILFSILVFFFYYENFIFTVVMDNAMQQDEMTRISCIFFISWERERTRERMHQASLLNSHNFALFHTNFFVKVLQFTKLLAKLLRKWIRLKKPAGFNAIKCNSVCMQTFYNNDK